MPPLKNPRHEQYAIARFKGETTIEAYLAAGYGGKKANAVRKRENAKTNAHKIENRDDVQARIAELKGAVAQAAIMERQEAEEILTRQARGKLTDYLEANLDGVWHIALNDELPNPESIKKITSKTIYNPSGDVGAIITTLELHDQRDAIIALAKLKGWNAPKRIALNLKKHLDEMTDDEIEAFVAAAEGDPGGEE